MPLPALTELRQEPRRENAAAWIAARELALPGVRAARKTVERHFFAGAVPTLLQERELGFVYSPGAPVLPDKIFALAWLGEHHLLMGTKCNRLLRVAAEAPSRGAPSARQLLDKHVVDIPLPSRPLPSRAAAARRAAVAAAAALFGFAPQSSAERVQRESCGVHAIEVSPDGAFVATGGANPCDMALLHGDTLGRAALCMGHSDWLFALCWLSDDLLASGARDGRVLLWSARAAMRADAAAPGAAQPLASRARHAGGARVRALALAPGPSRLASLSPADGSVHLYDTAGGLRLSAAVHLPHTEDLICLAGAGGERGAAASNHTHLLAVGSAAHVTLVDGRNRAPFASVPSEDGGAGVRSLSMRGHVLTVGGAAGKLSFLDLRTRRYLDRLLPSSSSEAATRGGARAAQPARRPLAVIGGADAAWRCAEPASPRAVHGCKHLSTGRGRLYEPPTDVADPAAAALAAQAYAISLADYGQTQAVYAHAWDRAGGRLAAAGGPIVMSARGCYAAVWEH